MVDPSHLIQKCLYYRTVKRQRRRQLQEQGTSFISQAVGLSQKRDEWFVRLPQLLFVGDRSRYLDRESKVRRSAITPFRVGGGGVRPVERRIDLCAIEPA
jgi:hypothetical protein